ncbi:hypothetical protein HK103_004978 [Boothiomyces macroporosus]|uniref:HMG box domain-containing protein n=1 Tax=Boothiomyces macroporosus TaxID=261099 RepID=A0AAD5UFT4_9FUNG|nr:hypothetical protein HK103_004978 [Boothiomyces macroporosus]
MKQLMAPNPKKPLNSFFLYRKSKKEFISKTFNLTKSHQISKKAAELWSKESKTVKEHFQELSQKEHDEFKLKYPDYDWQPWKFKYKQFKSYRPAEIDPECGSASDYSIDSSEHDLVKEEPSYVNDISPDVFFATLLFDQKQYFQ